jgi:hypothetical protein
VVPRDLLKKAAALTAVFAGGLALALGGCGEDDTGEGGVTTTRDTPTMVMTHGTTTNG